MVEIKELTKNLPDRIGRIYIEKGHNPLNDVTVLEIPNGRLKIMPEHRKPRNKRATRLGLK